LAKTFSNSIVKYIIEAQIIEVIKEVTDLDVLFRARGKTFPFSILRDKIEIKNPNYPFWVRDLILKKARELLFEFQE